MSFKLLEPHLFPSDRRLHGEALKIGPIAMSRDSFPSSWNRYYCSYLWMYRTQCRFILLKRCTGHNVVILLKRVEGDMLREGPQHNIASDLSILLLDITV